MSKVVCEVCGTAFADTADQCPICGTAKAETSASAPGGEEAAGYAYVKGGRFSQSNVRRHNSGKEDLPRKVDEPEKQPVDEMQDGEELQKKQPRRRPRPEQADAAVPQRRKDSRQEPENEQPSNIGLIVIVVVLLLAILSLCAFIAIRYVNMNKERNSTSATDDTTSISTPEKDIPCKGLSVEGGLTEKEFTELTDEWLVKIIADPVDTTQMLNVNFNDSLVAVKSEGEYWKITPVGVGETEIVFSCGEAEVVVKVYCNLTNLPCEGIQIIGSTGHNFTDESQSLTLQLDLTPATTTDEITWVYDETVISLTQDGDNWIVKPVASGETLLKVTCGEYTASINITVDLEASFVLEWACDSDITLRGYGTKWRIYNGEVDVSQIAFSSSDESVATVENGYVYIWKNGKATITAAYGNQVITMIVRAAGVEQPEEGKPNCTIKTNYNTTGTEFTIFVGDTLRLYLIAEDGTKLTDITFSMEENSYISLDETGKIVALDVIHGGVTVTITYQGYTYKCLIRVYEKTT